jgi:hypothetical protein
MVPPWRKSFMRDVTQLRQMQRELQNYAEQLEDRVEARTHELRESEERYRSLFLQEQSRAQHLSLINDVATVRPCHARHRRISSPGLIGNSGTFSQL